MLVAKTWGTEPVFREKRRGRKKKFFDEICEDERLTDPELSRRQSSTKGLTLLYHSCPLGLKV